MSRRFENSPTQQARFTSDEFARVALHDESALFFFVREQVADQVTHLACFTETVSELPGSRYLDALTAVRQRVNLEIFIQLLTFERIYQQFGLEVVCSQAERSTRPSEICQSDRRCVPWNLL